MVRIQQATTMSELLEKTGSTIVPHRGETVSGTILEIYPGRIVLDIGAKSEGIVSGAEYDVAREFAKTLTVGEKISAIVIIPETPEGTVSLSIRSAAYGASWKILERARDNKTPVKVIVDEVKRAGISVEVFGIPCFIPNAHLGKFVADEGQNLVDKTLSALVLEVDREKERIILSEKAVSEKENFAKQKEFLEAITPGQRLVGKITRLAPFGVFVAIEKDDVRLEGLIHLSELSWAKVEDPGEIVSVGETVEVVVLEGREGQLSLSLKRARTDPWQTVAATLKPDSSLSGTVVRVTSQSYIIEVEPGVEGIIAKRQVPPGVVFKTGDTVPCFVESIDEKKRRLTLGLRLKAKPIGYK